MRAPVSRRSSLCLLAALPLSAAALAQGQGEPFRRLPRRIPGHAAPGKIELIEFFMYGCPHCNAFEPTLKAWAQKLPGSVEFKQAHIGGSLRVRQHQRLFFTLQAMGVEHQFRAAIFANIHQQHQPLDTTEAMVALLQPLGLDVARFNSTWAAFDPKAFSGARINQSNQLATDLNIDHVPMLAIGGMYTTSPSMQGAAGEMGALRTAERLIQNFGKV